MSPCINIQLPDTRRIEERQQRHAQDRMFQTGAPSYRFTFRAIGVFAV